MDWANDDLMDQKSAIVSNFYTNPSQFEKGSEIRIFHEVWSRVRNHMAFLFNKCNLSLGKMVEPMDTYHVTLNPRIDWFYETQINGIVFNLMSLFYFPTYAVASGFLHEADHAMYLKENGMLREPEGRQTEFARQHSKETEIRSWKLEQSFLERVKPLVPDEIHVSITGKKYGIHRIEDDIKHCQRQIKELQLMDDTAKPYYDNATGPPFRRHKAISEFLGLNIDETLPESDYPRVGFSFYQSSDMRLK